jgi:hypothetical protein
MPIDDRKYNEALVESSAMLECATAEEQIITSQLHVPRQREGIEVTCLQDHHGDLLMPSLNSTTSWVPSLLERSSVGRTYEYGGRSDTRSENALFAYSRSGEEGRHCLAHAQQGGSGYRTRQIVLNADGETLQERIEVGAIYDEQGKSTRR